MARILVVDDNDALRSALCRMFRRAGHETEEADNGESALRAVQKSPPDLVITDLIMPAADGIETIMALSALEPTPLIIAISGMEGADGFTPLEDARLMGADAVFSKPFSFDELVQTAENLLASRS